jgi:hypothetical protein
MARHTPGPPAVSSALTLHPALARPLEVVTLWGEGGAGAADAGGLVGPAIMKRPKTQGAAERDKKKMEGVPWTDSAIPSNPAVTGHTSGYMSKTVNIPESEWGSVEAIGRGERRVAVSPWTLARPPLNTAEKDRARDSLYATSGGGGGDGMRGGDRDTPLSQGGTERPGSRRTCASLASSSSSRHRSSSSSSFS